MKRALACDAAAEYLIALWHFQDQIKDASRAAGLDWLSKAAGRGHPDALKLLTNLKPPAPPKDLSWISSGVVPSVIDGATKAHSRTGFEFATVKDDRSAKGLKLYELGQLKASECISAAVDRIARKNLIAEPSILARELAQRRGYLSVGSDKGMVGLVDGSDIFFDQYRGAFIQGVEDGL